MWRPATNPTWKTIRYLRWLTGHLPLTRHYVGEAFVVREDGIKKYTPLFVVIVMVAITDVIFAVDSIPAIFAITTDPFIVLTSNVFAVLGLRALYFLLAGWLRNSTFWPTAWRWC